MTSKIDNDAALGLFRILAFLFQEFGRKAKKDHAAALAEARMVAPLGLYLHKTGLYRVTDHVTDSTGDRGYPVVVVYHSYDRGPSDGHVRELSEFLEEVEWRPGVVRPRFQYLSPAVLKRIQKALSR